MAKTIYITIDDGPSKDLKKKVDFLYENKIPAIFFCLGMQIKKFKKEVIYAIKKDFIISNHSYNHPHFSKISFQEGQRQINKTQNIIERIYKKAKAKQPRKLFRFPFGDKGNEKNKNKFQQFLKKQEFMQPNFENITYSWFKNKLAKDKDVYWTFSSKDWKLAREDDQKMTIKQVLERLKSKNPQDNSQTGSLVKGNSNEIFLIHDHKDTTKYFFKIINKLIKMKFRFALPNLEK